jgi:Spy/CpxP family protein refolding chaperone
MKQWIVVVALSLLSAAAAAAQPQVGRGAGEAVVSPAELQKMFDAYALMQAQEQLKIDDEHYAQFLTRFKALQDVRRQALQQRTRTIAELRRLGNDPQSDENQIKDRLKALQEIDTQAAADIRKAYDAVDQILSVRQQAQFRAFEEMMERRKLELVSRARQANRPKKQL